MSNLERLESRRHFSVTAAIDSAGILQVTGTSGDDYCDVQQDSSGVAAYFYVNGVQFQPADVKGIVVQMGDGNDTVTLDLHDPYSGHLVSPPPVTVYGQGGDDMLTSQTGINTLYGGAGNDSFISAFGSVPTVDFGDLVGDLTITNQDAFSGSDHDTFTGLVAIQSGSGNDTIDVSQNAAVRSVDGGAGDDTIHAGVHTLFVNGGDGDDYMRADCPLVTADGGAGSDTIVYTNSAFQGTRSPSYAVSNSHVTLNGSDADDDIFVTPHSSGGYTDLVLNGDRAEFRIPVRFVTINGLDGNDAITVDTSLSAATTIFGNGGNDTIYGGGNVDRLYGGDGDDVLQGRGGNDYLFGGANADHLDGGSGTNTLRGEGGINQISYHRGDDVRDNGGDLFTLLT